MPRNPIADFFLFLIGGALFAAGVFLFTSQVMVNTSFSGFGWARTYGGGLGSAFGGFSSFGNGQGFGLLLIPFAIGVALVLADAYRRLGWFLVWATSAAIGAGVLQSLLFSFRTTSLWSLMSMVVMIAAGGGLMFKSLRGYQPSEKESQTSAKTSTTQSIDEIKKELEQLKSRINKQ